ncbi:unnamed protein product [Paramecium octaurelia]|uniref:Uncharacterized protein n=1 Tax=Paramecium octaurelia TaxID=43137 RepID=A0A8S1WRE0_PAROT|nr:unnamed protein product [Paramecium octaurelia]
MKMLDDIKQQVEKEMKKFDPRLAEKKYLKITQSIKDLFLKTVVCDKQSIKAAANSIGINYSSAKAIWAEFRSKQKMKKNKKTNEQQKNESSEVMKRCQYKILNGCNKIRKLFLEIKSSVAQRLSSTYLISLDGGTRVNQYFQSNKRRGDSALKAVRLETNIRTPKMRMQNSADDQFNIHNLQNVPLQLRYSPSLRMKNHRNSLKPDENPKYTETYAKTSRKAMLDSFYHQLGTDEDITLIKNTKQRRLQPIISTPQSKTTTFGRQNIMIENENIEEVHFHFVHMQQQYKSWIQNLEKKNYSK